MTRVIFLHGAAHRLHAMSAWIAKRFADNFGEVLVYAPDREQGDQLDRLLWTQTATGFIPHCRARTPLAAETPIIITDSLEHVTGSHCLLNLSNEIPSGFDRFQELVEIVSTDDSDRLPGRERFRFYRETGLPLDNRDISGGL